MITSSSNLGRRHSKSESTHGQVGHRDAVRWDVHVPRDIKVHIGAADRGHWVFIGGPVRAEPWANEDKLAVRPSAASRGNAADLVLPDVRLRRTCGPKRHATVEEDQEGCRVELANDRSRAHVIGIFFVHQEEDSLNDGDGHCC